MISACVKLSKKKATTSQRRDGSVYMLTPIWPKPHVTWTHLNEQANQLQELLAFGQWPRRPIQIPVTSDCKRALANSSQTLVRFQYPGVTRSHSMGIFHCPTKSIPESVSMSRTQSLRLQSDMPGHCKVLSREVPMGGTAPTRSRSTRESSPSTTSKTAHDRWDNDEAVKATFYSKIVEFLKKSVGARSVLVFDHTIRSKSNEVKKLTQETNTSQRAPVMLAHCYYTSESGPLRVRQLLADNAEDLLSRHVVFFNVWKPIRQVVAARGLLQSAPATPRPQRRGLRDAPLAQARVVVLPQP